ncbi:MAG: hypothetical protein ACREJ2_19070 [Planctomycetota bacterium]
MRPISHLFNLDAGPGRAHPVLRAVALAAALALAVTAFHPAPTLSAAEDKLDPVAKFEQERVAQQMRLNRLPRTGATVLVLSIGPPPPAPPAELTAAAVNTVIARINEYSGPDAPEKIDAVVFEINAEGELDGTAEDALFKLAQVLQIHDYPVFGWIHDQALDEAAWIALSCDGIYFAPRARLGGAPYDPLRDSAERDDPAVAAHTAAEAELLGEIATGKGYNCDLARAMADAGLVLQHVSIDGRPYILSPDTLAIVQRKRPGAEIALGAVYKPAGVRLNLDAQQAAEPTVGLSRGAVGNLAGLWHVLHLTQVRPIEVAGAIGSALLATAFLLVLLLALFMLACELWMEMRGYGMTGAAGVLVAYLACAAAGTSLGLTELGLFFVGVVGVFTELLWPTRRGRRGIAGFALIGLSLALTLLPDTPFIDAGWPTRHLTSEMAPALRNAALVACGGTLAAAALGLITVARLRRLPRYGRRWSQRFGHWDLSLFQDLRRQVGRQGITLTPILPAEAVLAKAAAAATAAVRATPHPLDPTPARATEPDSLGGSAAGGPGATGGATPSASFGRVQIQGRQFEAVAAGTIDAGCEIDVVDCTDARLIVRLRPTRKPVIPPWQSASKYEAETAGTKYAAPLPPDASRYTAMEKELQQTPMRYPSADRTPGGDRIAGGDRTGGGEGSDPTSAGPWSGASGAGGAGGAGESGAASEPATDGRKYPPKIEDSKYSSSHRPPDGSKYTPPGGAPLPPEANDAP